MEELEVVARSLRFMPDIAGEARAEVGILVDRSNAASLRESGELMNWFASLGKSSKPELSPKIIDVRQLDKLEAVDLVFVTSGLGEFHSAIFSEASQASILTVSTDSSCVDAGHCVMWVKAVPSVQIVVHRAAAEASDLRFQTAFRMLITER